MSDSDVEIIGESSWAERDAAKRKRAVELEPETPNKRLLKELNSLAAEAQKQAAGDTAWLARIEQARAALNTAAASHGEAEAAASDADAARQIHCITAFFHFNNEQYANR